MYSIKLNKRISAIVLSTMALAIIVFLVLRAFLIDVTHDEAYTFYNLKTLWWVEVLCTGNTHWLNFLAMKCASLLSIEHIFALRWLSLLSACVYVVIAYKYALSAKNQLVSILIFCIIVLNPYLLDYLFLARGYASGIALQALSLLFYHYAINKHHHKWLYATLISGGLSALANYNFYYYFVALCVVVFITLFKELKYQLLKHRIFYFFLFVSCSISVFVIKALDFITKCSNDIGNYGGDDFLNSIVGSVVRGFVYKDLSFSEPIHTLLYLGVFIAICSLICIACIKYKQEQLSTGFTAALILMIMLVLVVFNKKVLGVLYPIDRTTLVFFVPLFLLLTNYLIKWNPLTIGFKFFIVILIMAIVFNFIKSINVSSPLDYPEQANAKSCFDELADLKAKKVGIAPELYGVFRNYYQKTNNYYYDFIGESINTSIPSGTDVEANKLADYDYLILFPPYNLSYYKNNKVKFIPVTFHSKTKTLIVKVAN